MARRQTRRRKTGRSRKRQEALPGWIWMLFGLAVGLAVAAAIYVNDRAPQRAPAADLPAAAARGGNDRAAPAADSDERLGFSFYDVLPKFELVLPEQDFDARPDRAPAAVTAPGPYVLQAGSFSTHEDADRMKARLALLGIVARIQRVSVDDRTYHRVRIGPISDLAQLNDIRQRLRDARIEVMLIRVAE